MKHQKKRSARVVLPTLLCTAAVGLPATLVPTRQDDLTVDDTRALLEEWVDIRRTISGEKSDWAIGTEILRDRISLVRDQIEGLRSEVATLESDIVEADEKRMELVAEDERLQEAASSLEGMVLELEERTKDLLRRTPEPLTDLVRPLSQRIPADPENVKTSLGERFQNIVGILNSMNKFNREITTSSEVHALPNGTSAEVAALYVGIGQAYYVTTRGDAAGVGTSSDEGWVWTPIVEGVDEAAADIAKAIKILDNEIAAEFVRLPVRVD